MSDKTDLATLARGQATQIMSVANQMTALKDFYFDNGFNSVGSDPITDTDIAAVGITAAELGNFINFVDQVNNLLNNATVTEGDWAATVNKVRNAQL